MGGILIGATELDLDSASVNGDGRMTACREDETPATIRALVVSYRPLIRAAIANVLVTRSGCIVTMVSNPEDVFCLVSPIVSSLIVIDLDRPSEREMHAMAIRLVDASPMAKFLAYGGSDTRMRSHSGWWIHVPSEAPVSAIVSAVRELFPAQQSGIRWGESTRLTTRQMEILALVASGLSNSAIGEVLFLSPGTVKRHLHEAFERLGARSRVDALNRARGLGITL